MVNKLKQPKKNKPVNPDEQKQMEMVMQIIGQFAEINQIKPEEIVSKLKQMKPEEQQKAVQEMAVAVQETMSGQDQQMQPQPEMQPGMQQNQQQQYQSGGVQSKYQMNEPNAEVEKDEYILTGKEAIPSVKGKKHAQGGVEMNFNQNRNNNQNKNEQNSQNKNQNNNQNKNQQNSQNKSQNNCR